VLSTKREPHSPAKPPVDEEDVSEAPETPVAPVRIETAAAQKIDTLATTLAKEADAKVVQHPPYSPVKHRQMRGSNRRFHSDPHRGVKTELFESRDDMPQMPNSKPVYVRLREEEEEGVGDDGR
jgi:hypothetical protein